MSSENCISLEVILSEVETIQKFYSIVSKVDYDVDMVRGRYVIDAKSIMGIYSLDLSKPIEVVLHCLNESQYTHFIDELNNNNIKYKVV